MKLWEKVNNITGNASKARFLVEHLNAGAKFIVSSLPERFLWSVASEVEINGFDSTGASIIGNGSDLAYDKILAVYRYEGTKKRVAQEVPDSIIHSADEPSSLSFPTKMFPKYYKLSGKIYIKPDPDYNAHEGSGNAYQHAYTNPSGATVTVDSEEGDKGVIVYSAPPVIDENTDSWVLTEYENVAILYAASLDMLRLSSTIDAEKILEGGIASVDATSKTSLSAIHWLEDEDPEMAQAVIQVSQGDLSLANQRLQASISFFQRAVAELQAITGAVGAPEQQQRSQREEQGATS
tara:strand:+ start:6976 stop:7857 length:882 start_codon:yes stop_codon:yes gene_type:complete